MRALLLVAAVLVGGCSDDSEARTAKLEHQVAAHEQDVAWARAHIDDIRTLLRDAELSDVAIKPIGQWFCSTHVCTRDEAECTKLVPPDIAAKRMECARHRIAFCPVGGQKADMLTCQPTRERCEELLAREDGWPGRCLGVE